MTSAPDLPVRVPRPPRRVPERLRRLGRTAPLLVQSAVAAGLAYLVAREVLGHVQPFFAPAAAIIGLGASYRQRWRRAVEVVVGVAIGVGVGDLVVALVGPSVWVLVVVVLVAMSLAVLLDAGTVVVLQAGVQAAIVTTLVANPDDGLDRWLDAVVGGATALVVAALSPVGPLRRPREHAVEVLRTVASLLRDAVRACRTGDADLARRTLERARATDYALQQLRDAVAERQAAAALSVLRPVRSRRALADAATHTALDLAVRDVRVLVRRADVAVERDDPVPPEVLGLVVSLAEVVDHLAVGFDDPAQVEVLRRELVAVAERSSTLGVPLGLSAAAVLAQSRSLVTDLLRLTGLDAATAVGLVPRMT
ncbi:FUSC family protein [Aquipuribacter nitratireducens]|uniref:Aromatic acid exporter family protein n=1 Tax=Aquipuribacter nitratireducens TaxID=650104 RepID=A0ABW0GTT2_9MICO